MALIQSPMHLVHHRDPGIIGRTWWNTAGELDVSPEQPFTNHAVRSVLTVGDIAVVKPWHPGNMPGRPQRKQGDGLR